MRESRQPIDLTRQGWKKSIDRVVEEIREEREKALKEPYKGPETEFIKIPNRFIEAVYKQYLRPNESKVLWFLVRKTWGWQKQTDFISLNQFEKELGIGKNKVSETLSTLRKRRIVTQLGNKTYAIQADISLWHNKPKKRRKSGLSR